MSAEGDEMDSNLFDSTINALSYCEFMLDEQGNAYNLRFIDVNPALEKLLGFPRDELIGRTCLDFNLFTGPPGMAVIKEAEKAVRSGSHYETEYFWYPLNKWLEVQIFKLNEGNFGLILRDITERKKAYETRDKAYLELEKKVAECTSELQRKNSLLNAEIERVEQARKVMQENVEKYRTILNSLDQAFCILEMIFDSEGKPVDWRYLESNPTHEMYTRMRNVDGKLISQLAPKTEPYWFEIYGKVVTTGEPVRIVEAAIGKRRYDLYAFRLGGQDCKKSCCFLL
jgi:PAS domain S-box-containing protein